MQGDIHILYLSILFYKALLKKKNKQTWTILQFYGTNVRSKNTYSSGLLLIRTHLCLGKKLNLKFFDKKMVYLFDDDDDNNIVLSTILLKAPDKRNTKSRLPPFKK